MRRWIYWFAILLGPPTLAPRCTPSESWPELQAQDSVLFEAILLELLRDSTHGELQIDPRPLIEHPLEASVYLSPGEELPGLATRPPGGTDERQAAITETRRSLLVKHSIPAVEAFPYRGCRAYWMADETGGPPGWQQPRSKCPENRVRISIYGLPRRVRHYQPRPVTGRDRYSGGPAYLVHERSWFVDSLGQSGNEAEFVFKRLDSGWRLIERDIVMFLDG